MDERRALGTNGVACGQCHPNAANTHPETYPKFQKQLGKVAQLWEMVNWCLRNPLQGQPLGAEDAKMTAILSYVAYRTSRRQPGSGDALAPRVVRAGGLSRSESVAAF